MSNTILLKKSGTANSVPLTGDLALGEVALNYTDGNLFYKDGGGTVNLLVSNKFVSVTGNITGGNLNTGGVVSASGTITGGNLATSGTASAGGNITGGNILTGGLISAAGNITGNYIIGNLACASGISTSKIFNGTSEANIGTSGGNANISIAGTSNVAVFTTTGLNITGLISANGNITSGNVNTAGLISAGGNVTGANLITSAAVSAASVSASGNITGGNLNAAGLSLSSNVVSALVSAANITTTANIAANYFIGNGSLLTGIDATSIQNGNSNVKVYANANVATSVNGVANVLLVTGTGVNITGTISANGNVTGGNVNTGGLISAGGNVTGSNVNTAGLISAGGNITGGNVITGGAVSAASVSASGNITGGNASILGTTASTSKTTGALTVGGGVGVAADLYVGNSIVADGGAYGNVTTTQFASVFGSGGGPNPYSIMQVRASDGASGLGMQAFTGSGTLYGNTNINFGLATIRDKDVPSNLVIKAYIDSTGFLANGIVSASGNITGGNIITSAAVSAASVSASANITGGNLITAGAVSAASVSASGNVTGGNINTAGRVTTANINSATTLTVTTGAGDINLWPTAGNIHLANTYINHLATPVQAFDAATKQYVDDAVSTGITIHTPVYVESPTALAATYAQGGTTHTVTDITGGTTLTFSATHSLNVNDQIYWGSTFNGITANTSYFVYSAPTNTQITLAGIYGGPQLTNLTNGTGLSQVGRANPGVGATLTANTNGAANIDGVLVTSSQRVLIYTQTNAAQNGVYVVTNAGNVSAPWVFTRSSDTNTYQPASINGLDAGDYFFVQAGDTGAGESYVMTAPVGELILGYDNLTFTQFSASQVYSAGNGLTLTGTVFSVDVDNDTTAISGGNVVVKAGANLVTPNIGAATGSSLSVTGNVTGGNLNAAGLSLSGNVVSALVSAANITTTANITGGNLLAGSGVITTSGNITGGNLNAAGLSLSSNVVSALNSTSAITTTANITGGNLNAAGLSLSGNVVSALNVTGNITGGNVNGVTGVYSGGVQVLTINDTVDGGTY
jgi:hypothetical protein